MSWGSQDFNSGLSWLWVPPMSLNSLQRPEPAQHYRARDDCRYFLFTIYSFVSRNRVLLSPRVIWRLGLGLIYYNFYFLFKHRSNKNQTSTTPRHQWVFTCLWLYPCAYIMFLDSMDTILYCFPSFLLYNFSNARQSWWYPFDPIATYASLAFHVQLCVFIRRFLLNH